MPMNKACPVMVLNTFITFPERFAVAFGDVLRRCGCRSKFVLLTKRFVATAAALHALRSVDCVLTAVKIALQLIRSVHIAVRVRYVAVFDSPPRPGKGFIQCQSSTFLYRSENNIGMSGTANNSTLVQ